MCTVVLSGAALHLTYLASAYLVKCPVTSSKHSSRAETPVPPLAYTSAPSRARKQAIAALPIMCPGTSDRVLRIWGGERMRSGSREVKEREAGVALGQSTAHSSR